MELVRLVWPQMSTVLSLGGCLLVQSVHTVIGLPILNVVLRLLLLSLAPE
jgi:hypothetical protein